MSSRPRIVSLLGSATEILCALGLEESLLAISHECDFPPHIAVRPRATVSYIDSGRDSRDIDAQVKRRLRERLPLYGIDESLVRQLKPDLIITQAQCDVCAVQYEDVLRLVASDALLSKTRVLTLNPATLDDILHDVLRVAEAAGAVERGKEVFASLSRRVERVASISRQLAPATLPRVVCVEWISPLMTAGNWTPELIALAGGKSGLAVAGKHSDYLPWERIVEHDPEVLLIAPCGFDLSRSRQEADQLPLWPGWNGLSAVKAGRVFVLDGNALLNRSGPRIVDSLELIAYLLHPARFPVPERFLAQDYAWDRLPVS